jgi:methionine salvage enolase-phosphatase E1
MAKKVEKEVKIPQLKKMYNGMIWKGKIIRQDKMTKAIYNDLIKNHPLGRDLFEK